MTHAFSKYERGASLVSVMIAAMLGVVLTLGALSAIQDLQTNLALATKRYSEQDDVSLFSGSFKKALSRSDIRHYGFTSTPTQQSFRFLMPLPGHCADLSSCPDQTALLYPYFDDKQTAFITAVCTTGTNPTRLLIDTQADPFSSVARSAGGFQVSNSGPVAINNAVKTAVGDILELADFPFASLWRVTAAPAAFNFTFTAASQTYSSTIIRDNADCRAALDTTANHNYAGRFFEITIAPLQLSNFFAATALPEAENAIGQYPIRLLNVELQSIGTMPADPSRNLSQRLALNGCAVSGSALTCTEERFRIDNVEKARVGLRFKRALAGAPATTTIFDITTPTQTACENFGEPCSALRATSTTNFKALAAGETPTSLLASEFTLVKTESASSLTIRFLHNKQKKFISETQEQGQRWRSIDVTLP